jgi:hypothetical protein
MLFGIINTVLIVATAIAAYIFWIRPVLRQTPALKELYDKEASWWSAISDKLAGAKQKLTTAFLTVASMSVMFYDSIVPAMTGVDITPLTSHIPQWAYPIILIAVTWLLNYFRSLADKRNLKELEDLKDQITPK